MWLTNIITILSSVQLSLLGLTQVMSMEVIVCHWLVVYEISTKVIIWYSILLYSCLLCLQLFFSLFWAFLTWWLQVLVVIVWSSVVIRRFFESHFEICYPHVRHALRNLLFLCKLISCECLSSRCDIVKLIGSHSWWQTKVRIPWLFY